MAIRQPSAVTVGIGATVQITWTGLLTGDNGAGIMYSHYLNKTFQVFGTFGGATVSVQGSNDGVNWAPLNDATGTALTLSGSKLMRRTDDIPLWVRPLVNGGDGTTNLTVVGVGMSYQSGGAA